MDKEKEAAVAIAHLQSNPERWAFLLKITENPNDIAPKLIFADWLDENGEEDFAAHIRLCHQVVAFNRRKDRQKAKQEARRFHKNGFWLGASNIPVSMSFSNAFPYRVEVPNFGWYRACLPFIGVLGPSCISMKYIYSYSSPIENGATIFSDKIKGNRNPDLPISDYSVPWCVIRYLKSFCPHIVWKSKNIPDNVSRNWPMKWVACVEFGIKPRIDDVSRALTDAARDHLGLPPLYENRPLAVDPNDELIPPRPTHRPE